MNATNSSYGRTILWTLQSSTIYAGTVSAKEIARRRARNRVARVSRRINRARGR